MVRIVWLSFLGVMFLLRKLLVFVFIILLMSCGLLIIEMMIRVVCGNWWCRLVSILMWVRLGKCRLRISELGCLFLLVRCRILVRLLVFLILVLGSRCWRIFSMFLWNSGWLLVMMMWLVIFVVFRSCSFCCVCYFSLLLLCLFFVCFCDEGGEIEEKVCGVFMYMEVYMKFEKNIELD